MSVGVLRSGGGLIQAAVGMGFRQGRTPLNRLGVALNAAFSVACRTSRIACAWPECTLWGFMWAMPEWQCWPLYQAKNVWQWLLASSMLPKRSGKSGRYFMVLNCDSE